MNLSRRSCPDIFSALSRRGFLAHAGQGLTAVVTSGFSIPSWAQSGRPVLTHGVQTGDPASDGAILWSRTDRPARMMVEVAATESFKNAQRISGPVVLAASDFTGRTRLSGLPANSDVFYRVTFAALDNVRATSEPVIGRLRTAPKSGGKPTRDVTFVWSADTAGQGWGIDTARGGMRGYETMRRNRPDFFINSGDCIYADGVLQSEVKLADGSLWKNVVTPEKAKVAETLSEFRGNYQYNLTDKNVLALFADVPSIVQWDDHEVRNNWYPHQILDDARYSEKSVAVLSARAHQAWRDYSPVPTNKDEPNRVYRRVPYGPLVDVFVLDMRTYRGDNGPNNQEQPGPDAAFMGRAQLDWLKAELKSSRAIWKVFAADMPIGLVVPDGKNYEAIANGDGPPRGREWEVVELLRFLKAENIRNTVWLTADVHYTAAHYYDPQKARFQEFLPFWEFVSGPIHAGTFGPNPLDDTFGPQVRYIKDSGGTPNRPPSDGFQFFGHVRVAHDTHDLTVTLKDIDDNTLFTQILPAARR